MYNDLLTNKQDYVSKNDKIYFELFRLLARGPNGRNYIHEV